MGSCAALARIDAAGADAAAIRLALLAEVAASVTDWRTLAAREERLRLDLAAANRLVQLSSARERAGLVPGLDRVQAESVAASSSTRLQALGSERARILGRLVTLTARPAAEVERSLAIPAPAEVLAEPPVALPSLLLTNRPDILAAGARLRAADAEVAAAAAARFPRLTLSSALGLLALSVGGLFDSDAISASAGGELAGPLLDFGRVAADIDRAEATTYEAFANYRDAVFTALGDAEASYALVVAADRELAAATDEASAADRAARLSEARFRAGLSNFLLVLDARRLSLAAGERVAASRGRAHRARISLWQALGGQ
jgi:outer membrane protein TolC